jgi:hypothetical protein
MRAAGCPCSFLFGFEEGIIGKREGQGFTYDIELKTVKI